MNLERHINWCIYHYPTLYRCDNHAESRIKVLSNLFFSYGTGYEWHPDGYLYDDDLVEEMDELPIDFYTKKLYTTSIRDNDRLEEFIDKLPGYYYILEKDRYNSKNVIFEFNGTYEEAQSLIDNKDTFDGFVHEAKMELKSSWLTHVLERVNSRKYRNYECRPTSLCEYSALMEILNGHTNSPHIENFALTPNQEFMNAAIEIATHFRKEYDYYQYPHSLETPISLAMEKQRQIEILNQFLDKFDPKSKINRKIHSIVAKIFLTLQRPFTKIAICAVDCYLWTRRNYKKFVLGHRELSHDEIIELILERNKQRKEVKND